MNIWNWWGSVPPTRLRTSGVGKGQCIKEHPSTILEIILVDSTRTICRFSTFSCKKFCACFKVN